MRQPNEEGRADPQSLAPIQIEAARDDRDLAQMRGRSGLKLTITALVILVGLAGGAQLLRSMDTRQAYANAAAQLERVETEQREAYMRCALPNMQRTQLATPNGLHGAIEIATERAGKNYGKLLNKCTPLLQTFEQTTKDIKAPADVKPQLDAVSLAASELGKTWQGYKDYLQRPGEAYDATQAMPEIDKIVTAWQGYETARTHAKQTLSSKL